MVLWAFTHLVSFIDSTFQAVFIFRFSTSLHWKLWLQIILPCQKTNTDCRFYLCILKTAFWTSVSICYLCFVFTLYVLVNNKNRGEGLYVFLLSSPSYFVFEIDLLQMFSVFWKSATSWFLFSSFYHCYKDSSVFWFG